MRGTPKSLASIGNERFHLIMRAINSVNWLFLELKVVRFSITVCFKFIAPTELYKSEIIWIYIVLFKIQNTVDRNGFRSLKTGPRPMVQKKKRMPTSVHISPPHILISYRIFQPIVNGVSSVCSRKGKNRPHSFCDNHKNNVLNGFHRRLSIRWVTLDKFYHGYSFGSKYILGYVDRYR